MELEEVEEEYGSAEATESEYFHTDHRSSTSADPYRDINTRHIGLLTAAKSDYGNKRVTLDVEGEERDAIDRPKYKKETRYRRYSDNDDDNVDDPRWSTTVRPFESSEMEPDNEENDDDPPITTTVRLSFLEHFEDLPTIEEISSTLSEEVIELVEEERRIGSLLGKFVDPLTGLEISEQSYHSMQMKFEYEEFADIGEEEESHGRDEGLETTLELSEDSELWELKELLDVEMDQIEETIVVQPAESAINFEIVTKEVRTQDKMFEQALEDDTKRQNEIIVATFLDELLQFVVEKGEYKDPMQILRKTINKRKLIEEIAEKMRELEVEQNIRLYLNRKVIDYYKRKKLFRSIIDDAPETVDYFKQKYKENLERYDMWMGKEAELANVINVKTEKLKQSLAEGEDKVRLKILEFEDIVKRTLLRGRETQMGSMISKKSNDGRPNFAKNIFTLVNSFNTARKDISDTRLRLIKQQHLYAELKERLYQVQNLGNGLNLNHYEQLQNEVKQLSKKNEERHSELVKARTTRIVDIHINTHMKDIVNMLQNALEVKKASYNTLLRELEDARLNVLKQKQQRSQIRKETKECYHQGGLLSKPVLMVDYDDTVREIALKESSIAGMHGQLKKLSEKIAKYEQLLASRLKNKFK